MPKSMEETPAFRTPKTNIPEVDDAVAERQAEDAARRRAEEPPEHLPDTEVLRSTRSDDGGL